VFFSPNIDNMSKARGVGLAGCVEHMEEKRNICKIFNQKFRGNIYFGRSRCRLTKFLKFVFSNML
jgi:uncharacterized metal-binding protein